MNPTIVPRLVPALLVAYLDGELALADAAELEQRLATEPELRATMLELLRADEVGWQLGRRLVDADVVAVTTGRAFQPLPRSVGERRPARLTR